MIVNVPPFSMVKLSLIIISVISVPSLVLIVSDAPFLMVISSLIVMIDPVVVVFQVSGIDAISIISIGVVISICP